MPEDKAVVPEEPAGDGKKLAAAWAAGEARAGVSRVGKGMLLLALVLLLGVFLTDALLYGALGAALLVWKGRVPALLLLLLAGSGFVISVLRLSGTLTGSAGNVAVSLLALIGAVRGCQLTWS